jgi:hypothetical protein
LYYIVLLCQARVLQSFRRKGSQTVSSGGAVFTLPAVAYPWFPEGQERHRRADRRTIGAELARADAVPMCCQFVRPIKSHYVNFSLLETQAFTGFFAFW